MYPLWNEFSYKSHQTAGIEWMLSRESEIQSGGLLCDEMGLGKTIEILGLVKNSKKVNTLLLCPKAVVPQWRQTALKSGLNVVEFDGAWKVPSPFYPGAPFLFLTNYEKVGKKTSNPSFHERTWDRVVLDEAHRIKNHGGNLYASISRMTRKTTWCVTATPIINDLVDIRNLFALVGYDKHKLTNYATLTRTVSEACLHRSMEEMREILPELPTAAKITKEQLDFETEEEADFYRGVQGILARRWSALKTDSSKEMFVLLMRLRQLSLHPQVYITARKREWIGYNRDDWDAPSTKFTALKRKIEAEPEAKRWIVFCQFHDEMEILEGYLKTCSSVGSILQYHGGMTDNAKAETLGATHNPLEGKHQILLLQLQSGGVGLNLQHFTKIIFMSPWWTAALMDQAIGRAVRIGQKETVEVTLLVLKEEDSMNIDEKMLLKAETKRSILERLFQYASRGEAMEPDEDREDAHEDELLNEDPN